MATWGWFLDIVRTTAVVAVLFPELFLVCAELSARVSCQSKLCNSSLFNVNLSRARFNTHKRPTLDCAGSRNSPVLLGTLKSACHCAKGLASVAFEKIYSDAQKANMLILLHQSHAYGKAASFPNSNTKCYARLKMLMCAAICHLSLCLAGLQLHWARPTVSRLSAPLRSPTPSVPGRGDSDPTMMTLLQKRLQTLILHHANIMHTLPFN